MNPNYTHTITLYNRIRAADTQDRKEKWIRTVISGCFYKAQVNTSLTTQATVSNTYVARIPKNPRYLPYAEFIKKPAGCFTVSLHRLPTYALQELLSCNAYHPYIDDQQSPEASQKVDLQQPHKMYLHQSLDYIRYL